MSYILYGGMFDPPHLGHLEIARSAFNEIQPDILIWIPSKYPPHRKVKGLPSDKRVEMLRYWFADNPEYEVSDMEMEQDHSGYSIETIKRFKERYPSRASYFLIGSDEAKNFRSWKSWQEILEITTVVIGKRSIEETFPEELCSNVVLLDNRIINTSSTAVRGRLKENRSLDEMVDEKIQEYIKREGLYR